MWPFDGWGGSIDWGAILWPLFLFFGLGLLLLVGLYLIVKGKLSGLLLIIIAFVGAAYAFGVMG